MSDVMCRLLNTGRGDYLLNKSDLIQIRKDIENCVGQKVQLRANKGRKKSYIREGVLENSYANIFIVRFENDYEAVRRVSYNYTDVLTKTVELVVCKECTETQVS